MFILPIFYTDQTFSLKYDLIDFVGFAVLHDVDPSIGSLYHFRNPSFCRKVSLNKKMDSKMKKYIKSRNMSETTDTTLKKYEVALLEQICKTSISIITNTTKIIASRLSCKGVSL